VALLYPRFCNFVTYNICGPIVGGVGGMWLIQRASSHLSLHTRYPRHTFILMPHKNINKSGPIVSTLFQLCDVLHLWPHRGGVGGMWLIQRASSHLSLHTRYPRHTFILMPHKNISKSGPIVSTLFQLCDVLHLWPHRRWCRRDVADPTSIIPPLPTHEVPTTHIYFDATSKQKLK
jgi:hypothetical protein